MNKTEIVANTSEFSGNFSGIHNQKEIFITLVPETNSAKVNGVLILDGKKAKILPEIANERVFERIN